MIVNPLGDLGDPGPGYIALRAALVLEPVKRQVVGYVLEKRRAPQTFQIRKWVREAWAKRRYSAMSDAQIDAFFIPPLVEAANNTLAVLRNATDVLTRNKATQAAAAAGVPAADPTGLPTTALAPVGPDMIPMGPDGQPLLPGPAPQLGPDGLPLPLGPDGQPLAPPPKKKKKKAAWYKRPPVLVGGAAVLAICGYFLLRKKRRG